MTALSFRPATALAAAGSAALLLGALAFQFLGGLAPCELCVLQRWPHLAAIILGAAALAAPRPVARALAGLAALALLVGVGIAVYHVGIEQGWWAGPTACSGGGDIGAMSTDALLAQIRQAPVIRCDQIAWSMWGLSMAGWNVVLSLGLAGLFAYASSSASQYR